jgi:hypothetical protein
LSLELSPPFFDFFRQLRSIGGSIVEAILYVPFFPYVSVSLYMFGCPLGAMRFDPLAVDIVAVAFGALGIGIELN